jgi:tetratricopeptide (TPR) repeat protein
MIFENLLALLRDAAGNPERMTLATAESILSTRKPGLGVALEAAAIPHSFNGAILSCLLETDPVEAFALTAELTSLPMVEPFPAREGWNVHEATRLALRRKLRAERPELFQTLSARAAGCWQGDAFADRIEAIYHRLSSDPDQAIDDLERTYWAWDGSGQHEAIDALATVLEELCAFPLTGAARGRALLILGWIRVYRRPLAPTEALALEAFEIVQKTGPQGAIADGHMLLGLVLQRRGQGAAALTHYLTGQKIMEELVAGLESDKRRQKDLANASTHIGRIYSEMGQINEALKEFRKSQVILERLTEFEPDNIPWKRDLSVTHSDLGRVYERQQEFAMALAEYEADKGISEALAAAEPQNTDLRRDLVVCHNNIGRIYMQQKLFHQALEEYQQYNDIMEKLTAIEPSNLDWQRELFVSYLCVASAYRGQEKPTEALAAFEAGNRILRSLIELDPGNARTQRDLYHLHDWRGRMYLDSDLFPEALAEFERGKQTTERLLAVAPSNTEDQRALSLAYHNIGRAYEALGEYDKALVAYQADLKIAESLAELQLSNIKWKQDIQTSRTALERVRSRISSEDPTSSIH